jgi:hypothetical protein
MPNLPESAPSPPKAEVEAATEIPYSVRTEWKYAMSLIESSL